MAISFHCPQCHYRIDAPSGSAGRFVTCPACARTLAVPRPSESPSVELPTVTAQAPMADKPLLPAPASASQPEVFDFTADEAARWYETPVITRVHLQIPAGRSHSLQITTLVLGALSICFFWLPSFGPELPQAGLPRGIPCGLVIAWLAVMLGLFGLVYSWQRGGMGIGFALGGIGLATIGGGVATWWDHQLQRAAMALKDAGAEIDKVVTEPKPTRWAEADRHSAMSGDARVQIVSATIVGRPSQRRLELKLRITNTSDAHTLVWRRWDGLELLAKDQTILRDEHGNRYKISLAGFSAEPSSGTLYPRKQVEHILDCDPPVDQAQRLELTLPAANVGGKGTMGFHIPRSMWVGK